MTPNDLLEKGLELVAQSRGLNGALVDVTPGALGVNIPDLALAVQMTWAADGKPSEADLIRWTEELCASLTRMMARDLKQKRQATQ
jgi:hypothetical protein